MNILVFNVLPLALLPTSVFVIIYRVLRMKLRAWELALMIPVNSYWGVDVANIVSVFVASLIVGYVFAAKIHEKSRIRAIGRIAVFSAFVFIFLTMALFTNPYMNVAMQEGSEGHVPTSGWTTWDWVSYSQLIVVMLVALNVVFVLVFSLIGLYGGSMLRKPKKS